MTAFILTTAAALLSLLVAGLTGPAQAFFARYLNRIRQERSLGRLKAEKYYAPGYKIVSIYKETAGGWESISTDPWVIDEIRKGRLVLRNLNFPDIVWPMTCQQFEALEVLIDKSTEPVS